MSVQVPVSTNERLDDFVRLGFATFFLNRTNRSGILNAGIIGGRDQTGPWKIDARYIAVELSARIEAIGRMAQRIHLTRQDALMFLRKKVTSLPRKTLVYLDPPYYEKGKDLYYDFYEHKNHESIARFVQDEMGGQSWIVSYDNVPAIRRLYKRCRSIRYGLGYSAREHEDGAEIMFFSRDLKVPKKAGAMRPLQS